MPFPYEASSKFIYLGDDPLPHFEDGKEKGWHG
jgi:hypothetical protein